MQYLSTKILEDSNKDEDGIDLKEVNTSIKCPFEIGVQFVVSIFCAKLVKVKNKKHKIVIRFFIVSIKVKFCKINFNYYSDKQ
ncbi:hypothetical protein AVL50_25195 [Flammeovirga sp. SJP92]|nr:hypothetical protein AVL50_25195 [Flammeovirga sp. SJP92]